ncbi:MAG: hypothetical protein D6730_11880 [Bacteroidetes bacterium]|nr:MAG: hypothetical protein D6730_11880 [Bacteroidota bacterium]
MFSLLYLLVVFQACSVIEEVDEIKAPDWQPALALPLATAEVQLSEVIDQLETQGSLYEDAEGFLGLHFDGGAYRVTAENMIRFADITGPMPDTSISIPLPYDGLEKMRLKSGTLAYSFSSAYLGDMELVLRIDNAFKDGVSFRKVIPFTSPASLSGSLDLSGYELQFIKPTLEVAYEAILLIDGSRQRLYDLVLEFKGLQYDYLQGEFEPYEFELPADTFELNIFEQLPQANIAFEQLSLDFHIRNAFGLPIGIFADQLNVLTHRQGSMQLQAPALEAGITLNYPSLEAVGTTAQTHISLNEQNTNLSGILAASPYQVQYGLRAASYPDGPAGPGFITDTSSFEVSMSADLPLYARFSGFSLQDTVTIDPAQLDMVESASVKLSAENGLPIDVQAQLYLLDEEGRLSDSLFSPQAQILLGAEVDAQGAVVAAKEQSVLLELNAEKFAALKASRAVAFEFRFASTGAGSQAVKINKYYQLKAKLGVLINQ